MTLSPAGLGGAVRSYAQVERGGVVLTDALPITDGDVTMDRNASVRRTASFTVQDPAWAPFDVADALAPIGTEVTIYRTLGDLVSALGVFRVEDVQVVDDGAQLATQVTAYDRSLAVAHARLEVARVFTAGTNVLEVIRDLITTAIGGVDIVGPAVSDTVPLVVIDAQTDPWAECVRLAQAIGRELFFDDTGRLNVLPEPSLAGDPSLVFSDGPGGSVTTFGLRWNTDGVYNAVIAVGDAPDGSPPAYGTARDLDVTSPTYYFGPFGKRPRFYGSELLTSDDQAERAADAILQRSLGLPRALTFGTVPDPTLRPSQLIGVRRSARGINETHIVETVSVPLTPEGEQPVTTRTQFR